MKRIEHIIKIVSAMFLAGVSLSSCVYDDGPDFDFPDTIRVNTLAVDGTRSAVNAAEGANTFTVLFYLDAEHLENADTDSAAWQTPYLASHAPQPVSFYVQSVFDTGYPYPYPETTPLYAVGYAPDNILMPEAVSAATSSDTEYNYRKLTAKFTAPADKSRCDFLGCDVWKEVFQGSQYAPFAQERNKLYFRHLAAKLVFYADRDQASMENKQYVRNVKITNLQMNIGDDNGWTPMYTPSVFEWKVLDPNNDFTASYKKLIAAVQTIAGIAETTIVPKAGYAAAESEPFAGRPAEGSGEEYVLQKNATDRVPIDGMVIDSCYVCNPIVDGAVQVARNKIQLKMDISAEMSFDPNFPMKDEPNSPSADGGSMGGDSTEDDGSGSTTDDLTFTRTWKDVILETIQEVSIGADGSVNETGLPVKEFKPGNEYRIYIHFSRTGVNLVARELPWDYGGVHSITIPGKPNDDKDTETPPTE